MAKRRVTESTKQYVQSVNTRAMDVVRHLEGAKGAPMPEYIEPLLAKLWDHPPAGDDLRRAVAFIRDHWQRRYGLVQVG